MQWTYWIETEYGAVLGELKANTLKDARRKLEKLYPDYVGSDGELENEMGDYYSPWMA